MSDRLRRATDDRVVDMMRSLALRNGCHVVVASLGDVDSSSEEAALFRANLPEPFSTQFAHMLDAVEQIHDLDAAERAFEGVADAVATFAGTVGTGVHALLVRREGIVELALPNSGVMTIRSSPFPGFVETEQ